MLKMRIGLRKYGLFGRIIVAKNLLTPTPYSRTKGLAITALAFSPKEEVFP
jgi:hypothetical protein